MLDILLILLWIAVLIGLIFLLSKVIILRNEFSARILFVIGMLFLLTTNILKLTEYLPSIPGWFFLTPAIVFFLAGLYFQTASKPKRK